MDTEKKVLFGFGALIVLIICGGIIFGIFVSYIGATNDGEHTGYISSVEQEGWVWKTWRAYVKTDPQSSQEDSYCITDPKVVSALKSYAEKRTLITVQYSAPFIVWNWQCGSESSIITGTK